MSEALDLFKAQLLQLRAEYTDLVLRDVAMPNPPFPTSGGGYSDIYQGTRAVSGTPTLVAIKCLRESILRSNAEAQVLSIKGVANEISIWRELKHPNVLSLTGLLWLEGWKLPAMVSPWIENGNLSEFLRDILQDSAEADLREIKFNLLEDVVQGLIYRKDRSLSVNLLLTLEAVHGENIIHGGCTATNVLVSSERRALLCGFSNTCRSSSTSQPLRGAIGFMAPEMFDSNKMLNDATVIYTPASDIWSYGCLVCEVFTGCAPWGRQPDAQIVRALSTHRLFEMPRGLDDRVWRFVALCCTFDPEERPTAPLVLQQLLALRSWRSSDVRVTEPRPLKRLRDGERSSISQASDTDTCEESPPSRRARQADGGPRL